MSKQQRRNTKRTTCSQAATAAELLGPIVEHYLRLLDAHINYLDDGNTTFLFATRAGVRIKRAYELYLSRLERSIPSSVHLFYTSRLLACKGISARKPDAAINIIGSELAHCALAETLKAIFRAADEKSGRDPAMYSDLPFQPLHEFFPSNHRMANELRSYLAEQAMLFSRYLEATCASRKRIVLVDTGWTGTTQRLLSDAFPEYSWMGLYFGWMGARDSWIAAKYGEARGLIFNAVTYNPSKPETAISIHRHLIEGLFEPNAPSIEHLEHDRKTGEVTGYGVASLLNEQFDETTDPLYVGVMTHLAQCTPQKAGAALSRYQKSIETLANRLALPAREDTDVLEGKVRSADFGRKLNVPVLVRERKNGESVNARISRSLWPEGQIALEFDTEEAHELQQRRVPPIVADDQQPSTLARPRANSGRVAIITRTKDRPILLRRAARSVASQVFTDYIWVVVNDGGDPEVVLEVLRDCTVPQHQIVFCSNARSVGMEAASNIGIQSSASEFIVIHDDDDSWHPEFLRKSVEFLDSSAGRKYGGAITHSIYVSEEICGDAVVEHGRWPYQDWVQHIHLSELAVENFFPPIAFLFRRSIGQTIGYFDDKLPVLGDWDYALRFLLKADIGVIVEQLAYYHHRDRGGAGAYSNSVVGGIAKHIEYNSILRNKFIRGSTANPDWAPIALLMAQGYAHRDMRHRLGNVAQRSVLPMPTFSSAGQSTADDYWCLMQVLTSRKWWLHNLMYVLRTAIGRKVHHRQLALRIRRTQLLPPPDFDDAAYLTANPDVATEVTRGRFVSGFDHFIKYGRGEGRSRPPRNRRGDLL